MSDPVYNVQFRDGELTEVSERIQSRKRRDVLSLILLTLGVLFLSVSTAMLLDNLWAGIAVLGAVLTGLGLLLGYNK